MRLCLKVVFIVVGILLGPSSRPAFGQLGIPGFGKKNPGSNDQKASSLLHQHLPLDLDANTAYPTVPNEDLQGGPFQGRVLPITLDTLTKPLPPGDYVLPMTFFCSEYSIHRPGAGTAYVLAPAKGTAAKAISTLLWRGMLTGHKPQDLQSVSWAIQGSVPYDKMPANYKRLVDELIPDMKNQVNGQAFADIEDGFQGKVNRVTRKISEGIGKGTGGFVHADIKVDVELNESFQRLGRLGKMALDGENINSIVKAAYPTDQARERALYAGQGTQAPPLPAANGPWSVIVPGIAYMRFTVHGGNLQGDNVMQIRILKPRNTAAALTGSPHFVLVQYSPRSPTTPSLPNLFGGDVNQAALAQCQTISTQQGQCAPGAMSFGGLMAFSVGTGDQAPIMTASQPLPPISGITATPREVIARADISRNRTTIGVGEIVDLTDASGGHATWSISPASAGCLTVTGNASQDTQCQSTVTSPNATFTAFDQAVPVEVTAAQGRSSGSLTLTIIQPQKAIWLPFVPSQDPQLPANVGSPTLHPQRTLMEKNQCQAGALGIYYFSPDNVSFSRIRYRERNVFGMNQGRYATTEMRHHCGDDPKHVWCEGIPVGSQVRPNVGSRALKADIVYYDDLGTCKVGSLGGSITHNIPIQFSVRRPGYATITSSSDPEIKVDSHWGSFYSHDLNTVQQRVVVDPDAEIHVMKGDVMAAMPSVRGNDLTSYIACQPNDNNPEPNIKGAPRLVVDEIISLVSSGVKLQACTSLCTWAGQGQKPYCDAQ